jgi:dolichyl-phosphate beta-glucosyltransferase
VTSLVLPTYNPGPAVERTVAALFDFLRNRRDRWEILFVCDGCTDGTPDRLRRLVRTDNRFRLIEYAPNRGKGYAVRTGLLAAHGRHRIFTDVDLAYRLDDVVRIAEVLRDGADVAIACREHPDSRLELKPRHLGYALRRQVQSRLFRTAVRALLPVRQPDTQAGLKGMTAVVARRVVPVLSCDGFGLDCELLTACARYGIPIAGVPVTVRYEGEASTTASWWTGLRMLRELWAVRRRWPVAGYPEPRAEVEPAAARPVLVEAA